MASFSVCGCVEMVLAVALSFSVPCRLSTCVPRISVPSFSLLVSCQHLLKSILSFRFVVLFRRSAIIFVFSARCEVVFALYLGRDSSRLMFCSPSYKRTRPACDVLWASEKAISSFFWSPVLLCGFFLFSFVFFFVFYFAPSSSFFYFMHFKQSLFILFPISSCLSSRCLLIWQEQRVVGRTLRTLKTLVVSGASFPVLFCISLYFCL